MTMNSSEKDRLFKVAGFTLVAVGVVLVLIGLEGGGRAIRIGGPAIGFIGAVLLAQRKGRSEKGDAP
jgi:hypothetical protein